MRRLDSAFAKPSESPGLALWQVTNAWQRRIREALAPLELTHVQFVLLASLTWMDRTETVTQRELAEQAGTDVMMTSQVIRTLLSKGLIARTPHPSDGRAFIVTPTEMGVELANRANLEVERADQTFFAPLGHAESGFIRHLHDLARAG